MKASNTTADSRGKQLWHYAAALASFWTVVIAASLVWHNHLEHAGTHDVAVSMARAAFDKDALYRRWSAGHGGTYAPITEKTPPNPYLSHLPERDITTPSGRKLTLINPAYMTRQVHELGKEQYGIQGHITSLNPLRAENAPDAWETDALRAFERGASEVSSVEYDDGRPIMRLMRPLFVEASCVKCHVNEEDKQGGIRGGISVSLPMESLQAIASSHIASIALAHGGIWFFGLLGLAVGARSIRQQIITRRLTEQQLFRRSKQQSVIAEFGRKAQVGGELAGLLDSAVRLASEVLNAEYSGILEYMPDEHELFLRSGVGWKQGYVGRATVPESPDSQAGVTLLRDRVGDTEDLAFDLRRDTFTLLTEHDVASGMSVVIAVHDGPFGVLGVYSEKGQLFTDDDLHFLQSLANVLATVIDRDRVESQMRAVSTAVEQSASAIMITDTRGTIEYVNPSFSEITGYTAEEAKGKNPSILKSNEMSPEQYKQLWATITDGRTWRGEFHNRRKDGELYWESATISPVTDSNGDITHFLAIKENITELKRAEAALTRSEARFRTLYETSKDAIMTLTVEDGFLTGNSATLELFGCESEEEFTSFHPNDLSPERQPDGTLSSTKAQEMMAACLNDGSHFFEWTHRSMDGREVPAQVLLVEMELDGETVMQATVRDISSQKAIERELVQAQKLESIGQLASGIAHEINTPTQYVGDNMRFLDESISNLIHLIDTYADLMNPKQGRLSWEERNAAIQKAIEDLDVDFLKEEIPNAIRQSLEGVDRITTIVRSMKEFAHPGGDDKQAADLNRAIESTIAVARNEWKYVAEMDVDLDPTLPLVPCLVSEFNQVVLNMIVNAAHAIADVIGNDSGEKGTISISTRHDGGWAEIRIGDTGTGVPDEIQTKIFDPFFTTKEVGKGSGQGLAIVRTTIVKKHGGTLSVESEVGKGATFTIRLPIECEQEIPKESEHREATCFST